jgi:hypothetical protein
MGHHNNVPDDYPMDVEQTCFICPQNVMLCELLCRVLSIVATHTIASTEDNCLPETEELAASSNTDAVDHHEVF